MEIEIDAAEFRNSVQTEYAIAVGSIARHGWRRAAQQAQGRLDAALEGAKERAEAKPACAKGCWYCCYYKVDVRADEVFQIVEYVRDNFSQDRSKALRADVAANAKIMKRATPGERMAANLKCPFLDDGACSIYPVRPSKCRTFHARDVDGCRRSYEEPHNFDIENTFVPEMFAAGESKLQGYVTALGEAGYDVGIYELNIALASALTSSDALKKFDRRKRAFATASGHQPPTI